MPEGSTIVAGPDRRQRFRAFMKRFNPTAPAKEVIDEGLAYQPPGTSMSRKLAAAADLTPGSQRLLVGGIGSGKTTELRLAEKELLSQAATLPVYIDVSAETDLSAINSGALLASFGLRLWQAVEANSQSSDVLAASFQSIKKAAYGYEVEARLPQFFPGWTGVLETRVSGKLTPPFPALKRDVEELAAAVSKLLAALEEKDLEVIAIFDGLDRLINVEKFWAVAEQDLRALRQLEISVIIAGPLSLMYGPGRQVKDYFDEVHYLPPAVADPTVSSFLLEVLRLRGAAELLSPGLMQRLCLASGGVLRDLISLARSAGENAYLDDADRIEPPHVNRAIEQLGNSYLLGLGTAQKNILTGMLRGEGFTPSDAASMELLTTRRILEQAGSRYEVHPALVEVMRGSN